MVHKGLAFLFYCFLVSVIGFSPVAAQVDTLREVKIKSKRISTFSGQSLGSAELEKINNLSVADAVKHLSGVQLKDYGGVGGLKTINVRNLGSLHTGIFYDGIQLGNAQNGQVNLGKFSLDNVENISLVNGQSQNLLLPARAYALANSLNIESKKPQFHDRKDQFKLTLKSGSFGLVNPLFKWDHELNSKIYSSFSAEYQKAHGRYKFPEPTSNNLLIRENGYLNALRLEAGLYGIAVDSSVWSLQTYLHKSNRGLPRIVVRNNSSSRQQLWDDDFFIQASFTKPLSKFYKISGRSKYAYNHNRYLDPDWPDSVGKIENSYQHNEYYLSIANSYQVNSKISVSLATDIIRNWMDAKIDLSTTAFPKPVRYTGLIAVKSKLLIKNFDLEASLLETIVNESVKIGKSAADKTALSPFVEASWKPFKSINLRLRGFYKESFRLPTFNDQYYTLIGNADLKPEYTTQYDLGFNFVKTFSSNIKYVSLRGDVYYNKVQDKIVALPSYKSLFLWTMLNVAEVQVKGVEMGLNSEMLIRQSVSLTANLNYTYQQALDKTKGGANFNEFIPYAPQHAGSAVIGLSKSRYLLNYNFLYTGERYGLRPNNNDGYMEPWYTHDISAGYKSTYKQLSCKFLAEVNNLLNQSYDVVRNYPMPGRSYRITLTINY
ncbi:MAG: TonB-dependent receptor [Sphingobacteriaceae bacterium]|nr:TonB-dependent receptor [Sphingobacteriaceae bacterium]